MAIQDKCSLLHHQGHASPANTQTFVGCVAGRRNETLCSHTCNRCKDKLRELNDQTIPKVLATPLRPEKMDKPKLCEDKDHLDEQDPDSDTSIASERGITQSQTALVRGTKYSTPFTGFIEFKKQNVLQEMMRKHPPVEDITHKSELEKKRFLINSQNLASHSFVFAGQCIKPQVKMSPDIKNLDLNLTASVTPAKVQNVCIEGNLHDELEKCKTFDQQPVKMKNQVRNILAKYSQNESILWDIYFAYSHTGMSQIPLTQMNEMEICKSKIPDLSMLTNDDGEMRCAQSSRTEKNCDLHLSELSSESGLLIPVEDSYVFPSTILSSGCSAALSYCKFSCTTENKDLENQHKFIEQEECRTQQVVTAMLNETKYEEFRKEEQPEDGKTTEKAEEEESEKRQIASHVERLVPVPVAPVASRAKKPKQKKRVKKENADNHWLHPGKKNGKEIGGYTIGPVKCKQHNRAADHVKAAKKSGKGRTQDLVDKTDGCLLKKRSALHILTEEHVARDFSDPKHHGLAQQALNKQPADTAGKVLGADQPMKAVDQTDPAEQVLVETCSVKRKDSMLNKTAAGNNKRVRATHPSDPVDCFVKLQYSRYDDCVSKMDHYLRSQDEGYLGIWRVAPHGMTGKSTKHRNIVTHAQIIKSCINTEIMSLVCILLDEDRLDLCSASLKVVSSSSVAGGSNSGGGAYGSGFSGSKGSGNGTQQGGHAGWSCHRHGNTNDDDDDDDDNENRRPSGFLGTHASGDDKEPTEERHSVFVPPADYKHYRKKQHGVASNEQLCHCLGQAGAGLGVLRQSSGIAGVNTCLSWCLHDITSVTSPSVEDLACCTCAVLHSLLSHFAQSLHDRSCHMCLQLFTLIAFHIQECRELRQTAEGQSDICYRMISGSLFSSESELSSEQVWAKVRKYLSCALAPILVVAVDSCFTGSQDEETVNLTAGDITVTTKSIKGPAGMQDVTAAVDKTSVPESASTSAPQMQSVMPKHAALKRKPSAPKLLIKPIPEEPQLPSATPEDNSSLSESNSQEQGIAPTKAAIAPLSTTSTMPATILAKQNTVDLAGDIKLGGEELEDMRPYIERIAEQIKNRIAKPTSDDPCGTQKTYGQTGIVSMPEGQFKHIITEQNLSLGYKPTGTPGIGEVVYGTRHQLLLVARNWRMERDNCRGTGRCRYQHREEGVILDRFKKNLCILHTRYQKHHQWERLVHLGNGVTGKCHLCIDRTSSFKFCCKKIHILSYDDNELDIWSDLSHHNIVCFFGAIRHGERIYLFAEFIDGGSLTAVINEQWHIGRRLSHWTALNYFRQLLDVLIYLQLRGVLHEDIKADNLLLREGTTEIVLADFGVAQRICHDHVPRGQSPAGSPAHWSPEKAASEGHGFPSDLWAAACVLIHMLSGSPPWIQRYRNADVLNFLIWSNPPPMDDVPANVRESVRNLISCCLVKDSAIRPSAKQIRNHQAFQMLSQASSFFSTFVQPSAAPLPIGHSEPDPEKADGDIKTEVEACEMDVQPKTDFPSFASALKLQEDQHKSMVQEKLSSTCCGGPECSVASSPSAGCKFVQGHACVPLEGAPTASGCEIVEAACADRSVCMVFSQHTSHGQDETVFCPEDLPDVPPTLVTPVRKKGSLTICFQPVNQPPSQAAAVSDSDLDPYGTAGDSPTMIMPASPLFPLPRDWDTSKVMINMVTPDGAQPSRDIRVDDAVNTISPSAAQSIRKQTLPSSGEICSPACSLVGATTVQKHTELKSTFRSSCQVQNDFVKAASDTSCTANLSVIPEDEEEASATNSREEHFWDFVQDNGVTCQNPVFGRHQLQEYKGCGTLPDFENAPTAVALPSASPEGILPNFQLLSLADSVTLQSGIITGINTSSVTNLGSSILHTTQQGEKTQNDMSVDWLAVRDRVRAEQHSAHNEDMSLKGSDAKEEKVTKTETSVTRSSDDEHISSGDLFGPGPIKAETQHTSDTTQTSCSRKNRNLRLEMTATACHTAGTPREGKQFPTLGDNRTKYPDQQASCTLSESSGLTVSPRTPSPQSASVKNRPRSGSSPHVGSESSTPRSAFDQQEQEWNILRQESPTDLEFEPDQQVDMVNCIQSAYSHSYQPGKELLRSANISEESEMLSILQGSINVTDIAGHLLTFYSVQEKELFSMRVAPHYRSWGELVASVRSQIHHAGYQHFTLADMESCTSVDFFSPPEVRRIKVMEVSEDSVDTCWCYNHLIH